MAVMNFYFHFKLAKGGVLHKGKITDANNNEDGLLLSISLANNEIVNIKAGKKMDDAKFYKFIEKNLGNNYDVLEVVKDKEVVFIHNGSYLSKGILFSIGTIGILIVMIFGN